MVTLKSVYEPAIPEDGLRVLVDRRWPWRLDKAGAAIDRWEKRLAPSTELHRWFSGAARTMGEVSHAVCARIDPESRKTGLLAGCCGRASHDAPVLRP